MIRIPAYMLAICIALLAVLFAVAALPPCWIARGLMDAAADLMGLVGTILRKTQGGRS